jgi:glycogen synthase
MGIEGILAKRRVSLFGILNGVDYRLLDPAGSCLHLYNRLLDAKQKTAKEMIGTGKIQESNS